MDNWIVSQVSFWFTVRKIKPAQIVDEGIRLFLDLTIPGRGTGENNWIMRGVRSLEMGGERIQKEMDLRSQLRDWDSQFPEIHHEMIVRWICGAIASGVVTSIYQSMKSQSSRNNRKY
mmetsp:Transcript_24286/g.27163  ORF Transcript_24286/g.27163 Transcript_24286/m.27163 type:complete len:118 (-) Transcript_24286:161-514(-)